MPELVLMKSQSEAVPGKFFFKEGAYDVSM